jgi:hypothetical protein
MNFAGEPTSGWRGPERAREERAGRPSNFAGEPVAERARPEQPAGLVGELGGMVGKELRELAEQGLRTVMESLKKSLGEQVPQVVDAAVHRVTDPIQDAPRRQTRLSTNGCH